VKCRQTHGAAPWGGIDPIVIGSQIVMGLQTIVSRNVNITEAPAVVTVGRFTGGNRFNIVPETVELEGTVRTYSESVRKMVHDRIRAIATNYAAAAGGTATVDIGRGTTYPVTVNDPPLTERMLPTLQRMGHIVPSFGLDDHDLGVRASQRDARSQPAPAARDHDTPGRLGHLLEDLEPDRALARDDHRIVKARHHRCAALTSNSGCDRLAALAKPVVEDDLGSLGHRSLDFYARRVGGHDDNRSNPEAFCSDCHSARVIARRESNDTALALLWRKLGQAIACASKLERAAGLEALAFEPDQLSLDFAFNEGRALNQAGDPLLSGEDFVAADKALENGLCNGQIGPPRQVGIGRSPIAVSTAKAASRRVESRIGSGDTSAVISSGISVQTKATASQPASASLAMMSI